MGIAEDNLDKALQEVRELVAEVGDTSLWFLNEGVAPSSPEQALRLLRLIERHCDRRTYVRARRLRQWLSPSSSARSASSSLDGA